VEREAELTADAGDGKTVLHHLRIAERMAGRTLAEAQLPGVPESCDFLLHAFGSLHARRGSSGFGPLAISFDAIDAFARLHGIQWTAWEVGTLCALDSAMLGKLADLKPKGK